MNSWNHVENGIKLTADEERAIKSLMRIAKSWPHSLIIFGGDGLTTSIRKRDPGDGSYFCQREVATIGIASDGGDGGDRS